MITEGVVRQKVNSSAMVAEVIVKGISVFNGPKKPTRRFGSCKVQSIIRSFSWEYSAYYAAEEGPCVEDRQQIEG